MHRVDHITVQAAGFTNLTRDHLDYHHTMANYGLAKQLLFTHNLAKDGLAILNSDDPYSAEIATLVTRTFTYGRTGQDLRLLSAAMIPTGYQLRLQAEGKTYDITLPLIGDFQIMNALCAVGMVVGCGYPLAQVLPLISELKAPPGRMENVGTTVFVDYSHTPDALEKALTTLRPRVTANGRLIVLFGCGGDRDPGKRPLMAQVAGEHADVVYVTDDNPRTEDAATIRSQVIAGCPAKCIDAHDRASAIATAITAMRPNDILLIAGKGHEDYQIIGTTKHHFSDKEEAEKIISSL
jgi:UDP-N-acetylmuramoyl-L-alanyl-D-glutamate--2,6-diaminopimelate ligase